MDGARGDLLAGAALADEQHGRVGARDLLQRADDRGHRRIPVGEPRSVVVGDAVVARRSPLRERVLDHAAQRGWPLERLLEEVERALLHRLDRLGDRAVGGQDDDGDLGVLGADAPQEAHPVEVGHAQVGDEHARRPRGDPRERLDAVGGGLDVVTRQLEGFGQEAAHALLVVDDEDARCPAARHGDGCTTARRGSGARSLRRLQPRAALGRGEAPHVGVVGRTPLRARGRSSAVAGRLGVAAATSSVEINVTQGEGVSGARVGRNATPPRSARVALSARRRLLAARDRRPGARAWFKRKVRRAGSSGETPRRRLARRRR
ncbi:MAG: hypothetical protein R3A51_09340 [Nannocystaceae bacterium]